MTLDPGQQSAAGIPITNPLPKSWLGRIDAPPTPPAWAKFGLLSAVQLRNLQAQISYDLSGWDYTLVGNNNELGRYQFTTQLLEDYGLLAAGSNSAYGTDSVNYQHSWRPITKVGINNYENYFYNISSLTQFLNTPVAQEHLAYQYIVDLYIACTDNGTILSTDPADIVAGMIYVAWTLGTGELPTPNQPSGTGAWAWRFNNIGAGTNSYNSGRYAITILSQ